MDQANTDKIEMHHKTLYGRPDHPEEGLMIQIISSVKEIKQLRIASDKMRGEVTDNTRTNRNLIRLTWLIVGLLITTIGKMIVYG
jgi:hypothetical protein